MKTAAFQIDRLYVLCLRDGENALKVLREVLSAHADHWRDPPVLAAKLVVRLDALGMCPTVRTGFPVTDLPMVQVWCDESGDMYVADGPLMGGWPKEIKKISTPRGDAGLVLVKQKGNSAFMTFEFMTFEAFTQATPEDVSRAFAGVWK